MNTKQALLVEKIKNTENVSISIDTFRGVLDKHQRRDVAFAYTLPRCLVADDPGLGKTVVACALMCLLKEKKDCERFLVICESAAQRQWASEVSRFTDFSPLVIKGSKRVEKWSSYKFYEVIICSYELIHRDFDWYERVAEDCGQIILDEASILKNHDIKTSKLIKNILRFGQRVLLLSATPFDKNLLQMHSIFEIIDKSVFGSKRSFTDNFCEISWDRVYRAGRGEIQVPKVIGYKNLELFKRLVSPFIIRHTVDVVEMPSLTIINRWLDMKKKQQSIYDELEKGILKTIEGDDYITAAAKFTRLIQACDNPAIINEEYPNISVKADYLKMLLDGELKGKKVLIFSKYVKNINLIKEVLEELHIDYSEWSGQVKQADRERGKERFLKDPNCLVEILSLAGERGINLPAQYMICFDQVFNAQRMRQIQGRARRKNSPFDSVIVYNIITAGTVEEEMFSRIEAEGELYNNVLGEGRKDIIEQLSPTQMKDIINKARLNRQSKKD